MIDQTNKALQDTMSAIVDVAPDAPELPLLRGESPVRRGRPVFAAVAAFAIVLTVGVGTVVVINGQGNGEPGAVPIQQNAGSAEADAIPTQQDVVAIFDDAAVERDPLILQEAADRVAGLAGVSDVAVVSVDDLLALLGWPESPGPGIIVSTSGNADVAEQVTQDIAEVNPTSLVWVRFSAAVGEARALQAIDVLTRDAVVLVDGLLLATNSGPEPQFDTAPLGQEMILDVTGDDDFFVELASRVPLMVGPDEGLSDELIGTPVYLGRIGDVNGIVAPFRSDGGALLLCGIQNMGTGTSGMGCDDFRDGGWVEEGTFGERLSVGATLSSDAEPAAISLGALGDEVSVVAIELKDGSRYWQRPVGGSALFVVAGRQDMSLTATTFDSSGNVLITKSFQLNG